MLAKLAVHPESAKERDDSKEPMLPLLIAVREQAPGAVVEKLLALHPEAAKEKNSDQKVALHHAAARKAPEAAVRALIKAYPDALKEEDKFGKRPLTYAVQKNEASEAFLPFLEADMPLSLDSGAPVDHGGTWTTCVAAESAAGAIRTLAIVPFLSRFGVQLKLRQYFRLCSSIALEELMRLRLCVFRTSTRRFHRVPRSGLRQKVM